MLLLPSVQTPARSAFDLLSAQRWTQSQRQRGCRCFPKANRFIEHSLSEEPPYTMNPYSSRQSVASFSPESTRQRMSNVTYSSRTSLAWIADGIVHRIVNSKLGQASRSPKESRRNEAQRTSTRCGSVDRNSSSLGLGLGRILMVVCVAPSDDWSLISGTAIARGSQTIRIPLPTGLSVFFSV